ncbi:hypothetical protein B0I35DRAFT_408254 [Stachybotrys elegans]|uniref:Uncharacterized protein n=1 Tax=Stachybotrys elegans TaxID=80388 RepID=A0A8K0SQM6_9HYPO|nr:hypothetical protein B0I35DRAFT_408254 [Stachybotrys elegans]
MEGEYEQLALPRSSDAATNVGPQHSAAPIAPAEAAADERAVADQCRAYSSVAQTKYEEFEFTEWKLWNAMQELRDTHKELKEQLESSRSSDSINSVSAHSLWVRRYEACWDDIIRDWCTQITAIKTIHQMGAEILKDFSVIQAKGDNTANRADTSVCGECRKRKRQDE